MGSTYAVTAIDGVAFGLLLFVVAAGLALVFGVMDVLNLAHGTLYLLGAYLAYLLVGKGLLGLVVAVGVGVIAGAFGGTILSFLLRPLGTDHLDQSLVTLGISFLAADLFTTIFGGSPEPADPPTVLDGRVTILGHGYPVYRLVFIVVGALIAISLHLVLRHSTAGLMLRASVSDAGMASASGINAGRVQTVALAVGGVLAVVGGVLGAPLMGPAPGVDTQVLVLSLIVVVIGGAGSIPGTLLAALLVGQVQTVGILAAPTLSPFALFGALLLVLVLRGNSSPTPTRMRTA